MVGLAAELHVTVLNAVVDHLDIMASTLIANPIAACIAVNLCRNSLEDRLDVFPVVYG